MKTRGGNTQNKKNAYARLLRLFFTDRARGIAMLVLLAAAAFFVSVGPKILGNATDVIQTGLEAGRIDWLQFWRWVTALALIYLGQFATKWLSARISARMSSAVAYKLRQDVEQKLWKLPLRYYDGVQHGQIMSVVTNDVDNIVTTLNQTGGDIFYYVLMLLGMILMMMILSWPLALVTVAVVPLSMLIVRRITTYSHRQYKKQWGAMGKINATVEESFNGHAVIKAFGREEAFTQAFREQNRELYRYSLHATVLSGLVQPVSRVLTNVSYVIVAAVGAINVVNGSMTMGDVLAYIQYSRQFQQPFSSLAQMVSTLQSGLASVERVYALLDEPEEQEKPGLPDTYAFGGGVDFEDVSFSYVPDRKLIEHMNLHVDPGQMVAIVGGTGAGKTTLVNLIERFYDIDDGRILLDGKTPIDSISRDALRRNIGMVLQDTWLYEGTIRDNICYSVPEGRTVTEDEFREACKAAFVDDFVTTLPDGYDTVVTNELTSVSVGEKQLITIARAFLSRPNLLILDEATSSVDTRTEARIQKALDRLREGRTSFVIAHRLSTIRAADIILVMDNGHIVEQGNHNELMAKNGAYAKLYRAQFES